MSDFIHSVLYTVIAMFVSGAVLFSKHEKLTSIERLIIFFVRLVE